MKKRIFALLLTALLLLSFASCENEAFEPSVIGEFYEEEGLKKNSSFQIAITEENLTAPVTSVSYNLYNTSNCGFFDMGFNILKYQEGEWVLAPRKAYTEQELPGGSIHIDWKDHREFIEPSAVLSEKVTCDGTRFYPLEPGFYCLRVKKQIRIEKQAFGYEYVEIYINAYFTVVAPTE